MILQGSKSKKYKQTDRQFKGHNNLQKLVSAITAYLNANAGQTILFENMIASSDILEPAILLMDFPQITDFSQSMGSHCGIHDFFPLYDSKKYYGTNGLTDMSVCPATLFLCRHVP